MQNGNSDSSGTPWWGWIRRRLMAVFATHRPELPYTRGPGPKWREKHASSAS
jgi:hypothetical protein